MGLLRRLGSGSMGRQRCVERPEFRHLRLGTHFMIDCNPFRTISLTAISATAILGSPNIAAAESMALASAEDARISYSIPAQPLVSALQEYARQTHTVLSVPPLLVSGRASPGVAGELTPQQALDLLLKGTGLRPARSEDGVLRLVENEPAPSQKKCSGDTGGDPGGRCRRLSRSESGRSAAAGARRCHQP